jgi:hypothetical protein
LAAIAIAPAFVDASVGGRLPIASVALSTRRFVLCVFATILGKRFPDIVLLGEVALLVAPNVSFVTWLRLNQLTLRHCDPFGVSNDGYPTLSRTGSR